MPVLRSIQRRNLLEGASLVAIVSLAAVLRLSHLAQNPAWYADEAAHLNIALNALDGRVQYLAIRDSTLLFSRLPLFEWLLAAMLRFGGEGMTTLRGLTGSLGVITVGALYGAVRRVNGDRVLALFAALMLAIYPQAVLYSRFGFSYNLLSPLVIGILLGLSEYRRTEQTRWLAFACAMIGIGAVSELLMGVFIVPMVLLSPIPRWGRDGWCGLLIVGPFALYATAMLITAPTAFVFDVGFVFFRLTALSPLAQLASLAQNITALVASDWWLAPAVIGLLMLRPTSLRTMSLALVLIPLVLLGRTAALVSLSAYYTIPLLPLIALGMASLLRYGIPYLSTTFTPRSLPALAMMMLIGIPFLTTALNTLHAVQEEFATPIDPFLVRGEQASAAADYINARLAADDSVIASPAVAWLIEGNAADFQMAVAAEGHATPHLPADIPADRFAFDARFEAARFVVVDNLWRNWAGVHIPEVYDHMLRLQTWNLVFQAGEVEVYENPAYQP